VHYLLMAFLVFGSIALMGLSWIAYIFYKEHLSQHQQQLSQRLQFLFEDATQGYALVGKNMPFSTNASIDSVLQQMRWAHWIQHKLARAGLSYSPFQFISLSSAVFLLGFFVALLLTHQVYLATIFAFISTMIPYLFLELKIRRRQATLEKQLPDVLEFIARSLKAGHSFNSSIQIAVSESPKPISEEFKLVFDQINFGAQVHDALEDLTRRLDCAEIRYFVIAVLVNREVGGDLAELLQNVAKLIRERLVLRQSIHVLTAEGRTSAWILGLLPFVLGAVITFINPASIEILFIDQTGQFLLAVTALMMLIGTYWMYRISAIRA
jgi:tight adherence protein B